MFATLMSTSHVPQTSSSLPGPLSLRPELTRALLQRYLPRWFNDFCHQDRLSCPFQDDMRPSLARNGSTVVWSMSRSLSELSTSHLNQCIRRVWRTWLAVRFDKLIAAPHVLPTLLLCNNQRVRSPESVPCDNNQQHRRTQADVPEFSSYYTGNASKLSAGFGQ